MNLLQKIAAWLEYFGLLPLIPPSNDADAPSGSDPSSLEQGFIVRTSELPEHIFTNILHTKPLDSIDHAITSAREAISISFPANKRDPALIYTLAELLLCRSQHLGRPADVEEAISLLREAISLLPAADAYHHLFVLALAKGLHAHFVDCCNEQDLISSIENGRLALSLFHPVHHHRPAFLVVIATSLLSSFKISSLCTQLDECIAYAQEAVSCCSPESPMLPGSLNILSQALLTRYEYRGKPTDLKNAIEYGLRGVAACPQDHFCSPQALATLSIGLLARFARIGDVEDLESSVSLSYTAIPLCTLLTHTIFVLDALVSALVVRSVQQGRQEDLDASVEYSTTALSMHPPSHFTRSHALLNFALAKGTRFLCTSEEKDIDDSIASLQEAIDMLPGRSASYAQALGRLADALRIRSMTEGSVNDLTQSVSLGRQAVSVCQPGAPLRPLVLNGLISALIQHIDYTGALGNIGILDYVMEELDNSEIPTPKSISITVGLSSLFSSAGLGLERPIVRQLPLRNMISTDALMLHCCTHEGLHGPFLLKELGKILLLQFRETDELSDLSQAMRILQKAYDSCPRRSPLRISILFHLGRALGQQYRKTCRFDGWEKIRDHVQEDLASCKPTHAQYAYLLYCAATMWRKSYWMSGGLPDLDRSIQYLHSAVSRCVPSSDHHILIMMELVAALRDRYLIVCDAEDIRQSIEVAHTCVSVCPPSHRFRMSSLITLAHAIQGRYHVLGNFEDYETSTGYVQEAVDILDSIEEELLINDPHVLSETQLVAREQQFWDLDREELDIAIDSGHSALEKCPQTHPSRSFISGSLAQLLWDRFLYNGNFEDQSNAILHMKAKISLDVAKKFELPSSKFTLARMLWVRYGQKAQFSDLDDCSLYTYSGLIQCPRGHPRRLEALSALHKILKLRPAYIGTQRLDDRTTTLHLLHEALPLAKKEHFPSHPTGKFQTLDVLTHLAHEYLVWFSRDQQHDYLESAIRCVRGVLFLCPKDNRARVSALFVAIQCFQTKYDTTGELVYLTKAVDFGEEARSITSRHRLRYIQATTALCLALSNRYDATRSVEDLDSCIALAKELTAQEIVPPLRQGSMHTLASSLQKKYLRDGNQETIEQAIYHAKQAAVFKPVASPRAQLPSALLWMELAHCQKDPSVFDACRTCLDLQQRHLTALPTLAMQHEAIRTQQSIALDSAACAMAQGNQIFAIEMLEQGRAQLWSQVRRLRDPVDELATEEMHKPLRDLYLDKCRELQLVNTSDDQFPSGLVGVDELENDRLRSVLGVKHRLSAELDAIIELIRGVIPGFLGLPSYDKLKAASAEGPIILVNHSKYRSDAIILGPGDKLSHVELDESFYERAIAMANDLSQARQTMSNAPTRHDQVLRRTLKDLGDLLVSPVLEKLHELGIEEGSRIWWCPTSVVSALPLHAAGPLAVQGSKKSKVYLPDLYVSSYTPTLSALIDARAVRDADTSCRTGILSVAPLDGTLASVDEELGVFDAFYTDANVTHAHGSACTREAVLSGLAERPGVHFACHGTLKKGRPFDSAFLLSGKQKLTLLDIVNAELHNAELAILSACHTAEHAQDSAMDEALHLAAAMQFAGFRSVVGTMWQMQDEDGPAFALSFYGELFKEQLEDVVPGTTEVGFKRSARAVCAATRELRKRKVGLERWVNYVHIGA